MKTKPNTVDTLVVNLRALMKTMKLNKQELAKKSGVSERMIGYILAKERKPTVEITEMLAKPFGLTGWQLILPGLPVNLVNVGKLMKLCENYSHASTTGREYIDRVAEQEAKYKISNDK